MYTSQEERAELPGHHPRDREASQASPHRQLDYAVESGDSGLGAVSPAWGEQADLREGRPSSLYPAVAVGAAETPAQISPLDSGQILSSRRREQLGVLWARHASQWDPTGRAPVPRLECAHSSTHQNQRRSQSVRSAVGTIFRSPSGRTYGAQPAGTTPPDSPVEGARRPLCGLSATHHTMNRMA